MADENLCFVISPIGEAESDTRKRSDQIFKYIINPAAIDCGYKPMRADHISEPGLITSQVIQHIVEDALVIADLTDRNPNVFYELAIRHAIRKPLVQIIKKGEAIPFDVAGTRTIHVDHQDFDSVEQVKKEIVKQIKSVEDDASQIDTPISVALDLQLLRQSENPEQRSLADIVSAISELRAGVLNINNMLSEPRTFIPPDVLDMLSSQSVRLSHQIRSSIAEIQVTVAKMTHVLDQKHTRDKEDVILKEMMLRLDLLLHKITMDK